MILFCTKNDNDSWLVLSIVEQLLCEGVEFTGYMEQELPRAVPVDFEKYDAAILDRQMVEEAEPALRKRLEAYASSHAVILLDLDVPFNNDWFQTDLCRTNTTMMLASAGIVPGTIRPVPTATILSSFWAQAEKFFEELDDTSILNEYHLHILVGTLGMENTSYAPDGLAEKNNRALKTMFSHYDPAGFHDQLGPWCLAPLCSRRTGDSTALDNMMNLLARVWEQRPRSQAGFISPGGQVQDPLFLADKSHPFYGSLLFSTIQRNVVSNELLHFAAPPLAAAAVFGGESKYQEEASRLLSYVERRHRDPSDGLLFHASINGKTIGQKWGRGNTHAMLGAFYMIYACGDRLPSTVLGQARDFLLKSLLALKNVQAPSGLWRNVLNWSHAPEETSCSVLIVFMTAWLLNHGLLPREIFDDMLARAAAALHTHFWRGRGNGNCCGSWFSQSPDYYASRPQICYIMPLIAPALVETERYFATQR